MCRNFRLTKAYLFGLAILLSLIFITNNTVSFSQHIHENPILHSTYEINLSTPDSIVIGGISGIEISNEREFFVVDHLSNKIRHFNQDGHYIDSYGRKGRGPGEFLRVTNINLANELLYLFDYENARIQRFNIKKLKFESPIQLEKSFTITARMEFFGNEILITGLTPGLDYFVHRFDMEGQYIESFGKFIDYSSMRMNSGGKLQLTQAWMDTKNENILFTLLAPYRLFYFDKNFHLIYKKFDSVLPEPWKEHIVMRPDRYTSRPYPFIRESKIIKNHIILIWIDPESQKNSTMDLRRLKDGKLLKRLNIDTGNQAIIGIKSNKTANFLCLVDNNDFNEITIHKIELSDEF